MARDPRTPKKKPHPTKGKPRAAMSGKPVRPAARAEARKQEPVDPKDVKKPEKGKRLNAAERHVRDSLMIQRLAEGWTWEKIANEAGITVTAARAAVRARQEAQPMRLDADPVEVVQRIFEGYQLSIGDFDSLASEATQRNQLAVAVGAKKGANDAREKTLRLLQATGRLPQDLGALRHLIDLRAIAVRMLDTMDEFERDVALVLNIDDEGERKEAAREAARQVRTTFAELMGMSDPNTVEGTAQLLPAEEEQ